MLVKGKKAAWEHIARDGRMQDQPSWEQEPRDVCETSLLATQKSICKLTLSLLYLFNH